MGHVRLTQVDGKLPNLALMRLADYHRSRGDTSYFTRVVRREAHEQPYDVVYGSAIFEYSAKRVARLRQFFPGAVVGGTYQKEGPTVEAVIGPHPYVSYEHWPEFTGSIGFTQRGCRLKCQFCVVPWKEGKPRAVGSIAHIWRGAPWPKHIHLLDNDFFGVSEWQERIAEIKAGGFKVSFTQGINIRMVTPEAAAALASIEYRDDGFKQRRLYTAWDNLKNERLFFRGVDMLADAGVPPKHLMVYMLVGFDPDETWDRIHYRFAKMTERGIRPYPMVWGDAPNYRKLKQFQRWAVTGLYRAIPFSEYDPGRKS